MELINEQKKTHILDEIYESCLEEEKKPTAQTINHVTRLFEPFTPEEISDRIGQILTPPDMNAEVEIIYQTIEGLHKACPSHTGGLVLYRRLPDAG